MIDELRFPIMSASSGESISTPNHYCSNCNNSLENIPKVSKIRFKEEFTTSIPVCDALARIYRVASPQFQEVSSKYSKHGKNTRGNEYQGENEVYLCGCCAPLLSAYYKAHKNLENSSHPSSFVERVKRFRNSEREYQIEGTKSQSVPDFSKDSSLIAVVEEENGEKEADSIFEDINFDEDDRISDFGEEIDIKDVPACSDSTKLNSEKLPQSVITKELVIKLKRLSPEELHQKYGIQMENIASGRTRGGTIYRKFIKKKSFQRTSRKKSGEGKSNCLSCTECGKTLKSLGSLFNHKKIHIGEKKFSCGICPRRFLLKTQLTRHILVHSEERNFECPTCGKGFKLIYSLRCHMRAHAAGKSFRGTSGTKSGEGKSFSCTVCGKTLKSLGSLYNHKKIHTREKKFSCDICPLKFLRKTALNQHILVVHSVSGKTLRRQRKSKNKSSKKEDEEKSVSCGECGKTLKCVWSLQRHIRLVHSEERKFVCPTCGRRFKLNHTLKKHLRIHEARETSDQPQRQKKSSRRERSENSKLTISCEICSRAFRTKREFYRHNAISHSESRNFVCRFCGKGFKLRQVLRSHMQTHENERKRFNCAECGTFYFSKWNLNEHRTRIHAKDFEKTFSCEKCPKKFCTKHQLKRHVDTHATEMNYICEQCGKGFRTSATLYCHTKLHEFAADNGGEPCYKCDMCDKTYASKPHFNRHRLRHLGQFTNNYLCTQCGYSTYSQSVLTAHEKTHSGVKEFPCDICSKMFLTMTHVRRHKLTVHEKEKKFSCETCGSAFKIQTHLVSHINKVHKKKKGTEKESESVIQNASNNPGLAV